MPQESNHHKIIYKKVGRKYIPIGQTDDFHVYGHGDVKPFGIEVIIRDGSGASRHWMFATLDQIQKDYDWLAEALKLRCSQDLAPLLMKVFKDNENKSFSALSEAVAEALIQGEMKDYRKRI